MNSSENANGVIQQTQMALTPKVLWVVDKASVSLIEFISRLTIIASAVVGIENVSELHITCKII